MVDSIFSKDRKSSLHNVNLIRLTGHILRLLNHNLLLQTAEVRILMGSSTKLTFFCFYVMSFFFYRASIIFCYTKAWSWTGEGQWHREVNKNRDDLQTISKRREAMDQYLAKSRYWQHVRPIRNILNMFIVG